MTSIGSILEQHKGYGPGFHYMRVALAILVVAWHAHYAYAGAAPDSINLEKTWILWFAGYAVLVMFFILGGFLIAGSLVRLSLKDYTINRCLRIMPALVVEVVLSVFILGPLFTVLPLTEYFGDYHTYLYFTNVIGLVNYFLPGVFAHNPAPEVNNSLWTIPFEYLGYAVTGSFAILGFTRRPALILASAAGVVAIGLVLLGSGVAAPEQFLPSPSAAAAPGAKVAALFLGRGARLIVAFMLGVAAYFYRDQIPYDRRLFLAATSLCVLIAALGPAPWLNVPALNAIACPALVYVTLYIGVSEMPRLPLFWRGDYSYGVYLYGFPIQQAVRTLLPSSDASTHFIVAIGPILLLAILSWHFVEEPILKARRRFSLLGRQSEAAAASKSTRAMVETRRRTA
ncbi:MAG TPA: acyltransferase [Methylocystis sp.]|nr:acyltransferase [Methylocystis sp.]